MQEHWIRSERKARGLSQANLARVTGIVQAVISQWELFKSEPSEAETQAIREVFADLDSGKIPEGFLLRNHRRAADAARNGNPMRTRMVDR
jgi:transcriptional regulator with XRE-family HTH domain